MAAPPTPNVEPIPDTQPTLPRTVRRTLFAVALQLARSFGPLCVLVRAGFERVHKAVVSNALMIADAILFGARDRSRDRFLRSLYDQQQRSDSLHEPRPVRLRPKKTPASGRKTAA